MLQTREHDLDAGGKLERFESERSIHQLEFRNESAVLPVSDTIHFQPAAAGRNPKRVRRNHIVRAEARAKKLELLRSEDDFERPSQDRLLRQAEQTVSVGANLPYDEIRFGQREEQPVGLNVPNEMNRLAGAAIDAKERIVVLGVDH
jgi:hypothetical protein